VLIVALLSLHVAYYVVAWQKGSLEFSLGQAERTCSEARYHTAVN
jgi:hypothetical protein